MTDIAKKSTPRYIVMDAPGYHGTYAEVYSSHGTLDDAIRAKRGRKDRMVSTDGGWNATHQKGNLIHKQFAEQYQRLG